MKSFAKVLLLLAIPLALVLTYALSSVEFRAGDLTLEKYPFPVLDSLLDDTDVVAPMPLDTAVALSDEVLAHDTVRPDTVRPEVIRPLQMALPDSTKFRILMFGDSMLEGLGKRLCDYAMENNCDLTNVIWYSSSTKLWAETDTLEFFLNQVRPDYVLLCLGSNELFVRDLDKRNRYIANIVERLSPCPFVWISPPNWKPDTGINDLIIQNVGESRYFDSRELELDRASDHAHPTHAAAALWMDTIVSWLRTPANAHPLNLNPPSEKRKRRFHQYLLRPVK